MHGAKDTLGQGIQEAIAKDWGDMFVQYMTLQAGQDMTQTFKALPDGRCQAHHWGYVIRGSLKIRYADHDEVIRAGEAFYLSPGHIPMADEDCETVQFSSFNEFKQTIEVTQQAQTSR